MIARAKKMKSDIDVIRGSGGGSEKPASSTFTEASDTASNNQLIEIVDILGAGPWYGPVVEGHPLQGVILDGTPMENDDGERNWTGDTDIKFAWGTPDQPAISGFRAPASETSVGVEVRADRPAVRMITDARLTSIVVTLACTRLTTTSATSGSITGARVDLAIDVASGTGEFRQVGLCQFAEKASSGLARSYRIVLEGTAAPWRIRVRRITPDSNSSLIEDKIFWQSYTRVVDYQFRYPGTVIMAGRYYGKDFNNNVPTRQVEAYRRIVRIPRNYNPWTRTYATTGPGTSSGVWNGEWKMDWSDDPAWCFLDMATNVADGAGEFIDLSKIDKWSLYEISKYCSEQVDDGFGGTEPRLSCNAEFKNRQDALKALSQMAGIFNAMMFARSGGLSVSVDMPQDPIAQFTNANVVNGQFSYEGTSKSTRHTCAYVTWSNPKNLYKPEIEYVPLQTAIDQWGLRELEVVALGCNSRGQAHRYGLLMLLQEWLLTDAVTFTSALDGAVVELGRTFITRDRHRSPKGERLGGRIADVSTDLHTVTFDAPVLIDPLKGVLLTVTLPDGTLYSGDCVNPGSSAPVSSVTLVDPLPEAPIPFAVWTLAIGDDHPEIWRALGIKRTAKNQYQIAGIEYDPQIYALVDQIKLDPSGAIKQNAKKAAFHISGPSNISFTPSIISGTSNFRVTIGWTAVANAVEFVAMWRLADGVWNTTTTKSRSVEADNLSIGAHIEVKVIARNVFGQEASTVATYIVAKNDVPPVTVGSISNLEVQVTGERSSPQLLCIWELTGAAAKFVVEIKYGSGSWNRVAEPTVPSCIISTAYGTVSVRVAAYNSFLGAWTSKTINVNDLSTLPVNVTGLALANGVTSTTFDALDAAFKWNRQIDVDRYRIEIWSGTTKLGDFSVTDPAFAYTYTLNTTRQRNLEIRVWGVNVGGESAAPAVLSVSNPQIAAATVAATRNGASSLLVTVSHPTASDYAGTLYVASTNPSANPNTLPVLVDAPSWYAVVNITPGVYGTWYFWAADYDKFGQDSLNWSPAGSIIVLEEPTGIQTVSDASTITATTGSDAPGGAAYRAVFDATTKKMWMWHSELSPARYTKSYAASEIDGFIQKAQLNPGITWTADQVLVSPDSAIGNDDFSDTTYWTLGAPWARQVSATGNAAAALGLKAAAVIAAGFAGVPSYSYADAPCPYGAGDVVRLRATASNSSNQNLRVDLQFFSLAGGGFLGSAALTWTPGQQGWKSVQIAVPNGAQFVRAIFYNVGGTAFTGNVAVGKISVSLAVGASLVVDGSITASALAANSVNAASIQAGAVTADKISVASLSAITAYLGTLISATMELVASGWSYIRTSGKWWGDGVNGWVQASRGDNGSFFQEFRAQVGGGGLVHEMKGGGPDLGGIYYKLQVVDGPGHTRLHIEPTAGIYQFGGTLTADAIDAIDTINIRGEAVTVSRAAYAESVTSVSVVINPGRGAVALFLSGKIWNDDITDCSLAVYRDGVLIASRPGVIGPHTVIPGTEGDPDTTIPSTALVNDLFFDPAPGAYAHNYTVAISSTGTANHFTYATLLAHGVKA